MIYTAKGFLTPKEFEDLVNRYAPRGVSREALQRLFSGTAIHPPQPFSPLQPAQPYPQREELERWLEEQNYPYLNLYEFLGVQPPATPEELLARVEQKDREILQAVAPTPELLAERTLCAICRRTFADAQTLAGYNLYFYGHPLPQISIMVCRQGYANGGHITSAMHQALIRSALQTYSGEINTEDAALCVQRVAEAEGFRLDPLPAAPALPQPGPAPPAPRPLAQPAPPPAPAGEFREEDLPELLPLPFGRMPEMPPLVFPSYPAQDVQVDRVYEVMKLASQSETDHRENLEFLLQRFPQHPKVLLLQLSFEAGTGVRMEELYTSSLDITQCPSWQQAYAANPQNREFLLLAAAYSRRNAREKKLSAPVALAVTAGYVLLFVLRIVPHLTEWMNRLNTSFLHMVVFLWPVLPHSLSMGLCTRLNRQGSRLPGVLRILFGGGLWGVAYQVVRSQRVFSLSWVAGFLAFLLFFGVLALSDAVPGLAVIGRSRIAVPQRSRRAALGGIVLLGCWWRRRVRCCTLCWRWQWPAVDLSSTVWGIDPASFAFWRWCRPLSLSLAVWGISSPAFYSPAGYYLGKEGLSCPISAAPITTGMAIGAVKKAPIKRPPTPILIPTAPAKKTAKTAPITTVKSWGSAPGPRKNSGGLFLIPPGDKFSAVCYT